MARPAYLSPWRRRTAFAPVDRVEPASTDTEPLPLQSSGSASAPEAGQTAARPPHRPSSPPPRPSAAPRTPDTPPAPAPVARPAPSAPPARPPPERPSARIVPRPLNTPSTRSTRLRERGALYRRASVAPRSGPTSGKAAEAAAAQPAEPLAPQRKSEPFEKVEIPPSRETAPSTPPPAAVQRAPETPRAPMEPESVARPAAPLPLHQIGVGTVLRERYELETLLGSGGMGSVYQALDRYRASLGLPDATWRSRSLRRCRGAPARVRSAASFRARSSSRIPT